MKKILLSLALALVAVASHNNASAQLVQGPNIRFETDTHDYGDIKKGSDGIYYFEFTNTGNQPLVISDAKGSCGCTVPQFSKEPVAPGSKGKIMVDYDSENRVGPISRSVTITSNSVEEPVKVLYIKGNVLPPAEGASPVMSPSVPARN